ncbi:MAG: AAA family ATPase [Nitrospinae bacterium]|nr:AAA family ATPase [Nitrospinota bacterium]
MSDHRLDQEPESPSETPNDSAPHGDKDPLVLVDQCLASLPQETPEHKLLYKIRHLLLQEGATRQQREAELKKLATAVEKLTAPANRIGTLLDLPEEGIARIAVGGSEFYANIDPRLQKDDLKLGTQILVNEAYVVINTLGYDRNGPIIKVKEVLKDGRIRLDSEPGRPGMLLDRGSDLQDIELKSGDEVRLDPHHRLALERLEPDHATRHDLDRIPTVTWEQIGGQKPAIDSIRRAIEYPLLHAKTFKDYQFTQPKGFLLHGPPGCGKTLIGQATAASLAKLVSEQGTTPSESPATPEKGRDLPPISGGTFLHVKGPEILNMWVGESERIIRELFAQAKERRKAGFLPFLFIDEAESVLGTRRALRSYNISNTLVPMFCAELDGIESLQDVVVILASNRPDLIDPAVLRPGRIDRKIKVTRPGRDEAMDILRIYLHADLPFDEELLAQHKGDRHSACDALIGETIGNLFRRTEDTRVLGIRLRNGKRVTLYQSDMLSGAILSSIVQRAKERAIERTIQGTGAGLTMDDLLTSTQDEFREGEILPPDDSAEEWLKLLDHHPDQVIGISSLRKGRTEEERLITAII